MTTDQAATGTLPQPPSPQDHTPSGEARPPAEDTRTAGAPVVDGIRLPGETVVVAAPSAVGSALAVEGPPSAEGALPAGPSVVDGKPVDGIRLSGETVVVPAPSAVGSAPAVDGPPLVGSSLPAGPRLPAQGPLVVEPALAEEADAAPLPNGDDPAVAGGTPTAPVMAVGVVSAPAPARRGPAPSVRAVRLSAPAGASGDVPPRRKAVRVTPVRLPLPRPVPTAPPTTPTEEPQP
ncbi:hypothetical protein ACFC0D_23685 [Streptomyces sp. NPDC056222]|uniref:hypothetical protein n=1 Tax=Streptomyces sp. NPDC056222 TaxID=3345749 RepID=UPI0035DE9C40